MTETTQFFGPAQDVPPCPKKKMSRFTNLLPADDNNLLKSVAHMLADRILPGRRQGSMANLTPTEAEIARTRAEIAQLRAERSTWHQNVSQEIEDPENDPRVKEVLQGSAARLILRMNGKPAPPPQTEADRLADEYMALQVAKATAPETRAREDVERMSADFEKRTGIRITGASPQLSEEEEVRNMVGVFTKRTGMCITGVNAPRTDEEAFKNLAEDFEKKFGLRVV